VFVERGRAAVRTIRENLIHTGLEGRGKIVRADVFEYLSREARPFDIVFVAPPQYKGLWCRTLEYIDRCRSWLDARAQVVVQIHPREFADVPTGGLALVDRRSYGSVMLCFYELAPPPAAPV
jgi:16S rRNA G966 N2-methylase RsmD